MPEPYIGWIGKRATTPTIENLAIKFGQFAISIAVDSYPMYYMTQV